MRQPQELGSAGGRQVQVQRFELQGNRLIASDVLQASLSLYQNRLVGLSDLRRAAAAIAEVYARAGWLARVYLPPQDVTDGIIHLQIEEARFGSVRVEKGGTTLRFDEARAVAMILVQQSPGEPLRMPAIDRGLALLADLPGVSSKASFVAGTQAGETDLRLELSDEALLLGDAGLDNAGSRSTGQNRLSAKLGLAGWLGVGDMLTVDVNHTKGSDYAHIAASAPLGLQGWRGSVNASRMQYRLIEAGFAALQAKGEARTWSLDATFAALRTRERNLSVQLSIENKHFRNDANGSTSSDYTSGLVSAGLSGNLFDTLGGSAANAAGLILSQGRLNLSGSPSFASDSAGPKTQGSFTKLRYSFSRQQFLSPDLSLYALIAGQTSDRNLDSSEKFFLGGAQAVRAYPASEAGGARGQIVKFELRAQLQANFRGAVFYDWGHIQVNVDNNFPGAPTVNKATLQGLGVGLTWAGPHALNLALSVATRIGHNPLANAAGLDQDGTLQRTRVWMQASLAL
ncbi:ShlB/FhaC/HecB family hemolysin secretion/activation protein [Roseateles sp.]|uniref:ShlB/FhaC/HecB family hemolysin secretion/activation protein n=1 Tax=Roseateles sp. TaxID=1971397 RepID=UPI003BA4C6AE